MKATALDFTDDYLIISLQEARIVQVLLIIVPWAVHGNPWATSKLSVDR